MTGDPSFNTISQSAHFFCGAYILHLFHGNFWIILIAVGLAALKEFWYDYHFESKEVRGSSFEDFLFYCLGIGVGVTTSIWDPSMLLRF